MIRAVEIESLPARPARHGKGYEDGYDDLEPEQLSRVKIVLNAGKHEWEGNHGVPISLVDSAPDGPEIVDALVLRGISN